MPGAVIVADQPLGAGPGTPGISRNDLYRSQPVNLSIATSGNPGPFLWELLDKPPGSAATLSGATTSTSSFLPDLHGTYRVRLTTNGGGAGNTQTRVYRVTLDSSGNAADRLWALPAYGETAGEDNADGNVRGWAPRLEYIIADILANFSGGGGGGGGINSIAGLTAPAITITNGGGVRVVPNVSNLAFSIGFSGIEADGDIPVRTGGSYVQKPKGTDGQVLTMVSGVVTWATPTSPFVPSAGGAPPAVAGSSSAGTGTAYSLANHTHAGVTSLNGQQGALILTLPVPGAAPPAVAAASSAGAASSYSSSDHTHAGVGSWLGLTGALTYTNGGGVLLTGAGTSVTGKIAFGSDAEGDIPRAGSGGTYGRLGIGGNGTVLTSNGTTFGWATPATPTLPGGSDGEVYAANGGVQGFTNSPRLGGPLTYLTATNIIQNASNQSIFNIAGAFLNVGNASVNTGGVALTTGASGQYRFLHGALISWNITRSANVVSMATDAAAVGLNITLATTAQGSGTSGNLTISGQDASNAAVNIGNVIVKVGRNTADATKIGKFQITTGAATWMELDNTGVSFAPGGANVAFRFGSLSLSPAGGDKVILLAPGTAPGALTGCVGIWNDAGVLKAMGASGSPSILAS